MNLESVLIENRVGVVRRETVGTRRYIVAPAVLIVPGVLNGSRGALLYTEEDAARNVDSWNGMPITVGHPSMNGRPVTARHPKVWAQWRVGEVFQTNHDGRLVSELWIDVEAADRVSPGLTTAIESGAKIELSTGLGLDVEPVKGVHAPSGRPYDGIARNWKPDHVAILVRGRGACSVDDGCGVNVNLESTGDGSTEGEMYWNRDFSADQRKKLADEGKAMPDGSFPIVTKEDLHNAIKAYGRASDKEAAKRHIIKRAKALGMTGDLPDGWTTNESSNTDGGRGNVNREQLIQLLTTNCECWKERTDTLNKMSDAELQAMCNDMQQRQRSMNELKQQLADANGTIAAVRNGLGVNELPPAADVSAFVKSKINVVQTPPPPAPTPAPAPATNTQTNKTFSQLLQESGTDEEKATWNHAVNIVREKRATLIEQIVNSETRDDQAKVALRTIYSKLSTEDLQARAKYIPAPPTQQALNFFPDGGRSNNQGDLGVNADDILTASAW